MNKILKCEFYVSSKYVNTETKEVVEVIIPEGTPENEEEDIVREWFEEWVWQNIEHSYEILDE